MRVYPVKGVFLAEIRGKDDPLYAVDATKSWNLAGPPARSWSLRDRSGDLPSIVCECRNLSGRRGVQERRKGSACRN